MALAQAGERGTAKAVFDMLNPILRARDPAAAQHYGVEPYVVAADIAAAEPHCGRGGWTWYTGSAAWTWRFGVEWLLGLRRVEGKLKIDPRLPPGWTGYQATLRGDKGSILVRVTDPDGLGAGRIGLSVDGKPFAGDLIDFPDDGSVRQVEARLVG
jgi:cyclic beta-1,2-glucan synthetase